MALPAVTPPAAPDRGSRRSRLPAVLTWGRAPVIRLALVFSALLVAYGCGGADAPGEADAQGTPSAAGAPDVLADDRPPYYTTLDRLPVDFNTAGSVAGSGWAGAEVVEGTLVVEGRFEGLLSAATEAHLHRAKPGLRGPPVVALALEPGGDGRDGVVRGAVPLDPSLEAALAGGELYVQVRSENNPEGVLRGWLHAW